MAPKKISFKAAKATIPVLTCSQLLNEVCTGAHGKMFMVKKVNVEDFEGGANKGQYTI